jgi:anti-sigma B factor antagonist
MSLRITQTIAGDVTILKCDGRITLGVDPALRSRVEAAMQGGAKDIVLDLTGLDYVDSSGIGSLVSSFTFARNSGGRLVLVGLNKKVKDLLQITKLYTVFQMFENTDAALASLRGDTALKGADGA